MAFYGCHFSFNGVSCEEYGLMMYDFAGSKGEKEDVLVPSGKVSESRISRRYTPLHYGVSRDKPLEFKMSFGAEIDAVDRGHHFDRWDLEAIARWLTSDTYKWLEIEQPDMETFRYRCIIQDLKHVDIRSEPWGFTCSVLCDSPYAYTLPEKYEISSEGGSILNRSSLLMPYKPTISVALSGGGSFSIINQSDNGREMKFTDLPTTVTSIEIDCENEVITSPDMDNLYRYFNFQFFRLVPGMNTIQIDGDGTAEITCQFPVSIGG